MPGELGIVVRLANSAATVHYTTCFWYQRAQRRLIPLTPNMKIKLCTWCRPYEGDIRAEPPAVEWYAWSHSPRGTRPKVVHMDLDQAENIAARHEMGWGKTPIRKAGM